MKLRTDQNGFSVVEATILVVLVVVIGFVGYRAMNKSTTKPANILPGAVEQAAVPSKIGSKADVKTAAKALDQTPIDSKLDPNQLDSGISALL